MRILFIGLLIIGCCIACSSEQGGEGSVSTDVAADTVYVVDTVREMVALDTSLAAETASLTVFFEKYGVEGSFLLYDPQENRYYSHNKARTKKEFLPASTYKILHSLIALETGVIADTNVVLKWDGQERAVEAWNRDQHMKDAFRNSTVWFYQEMARRIGRKRMQHYVREANYGNEKIDGDIDMFWLNGDLRITMEDQIKFLRNLYRNDLPFSRQNMEKVKSIMTYMVSDQYTVYGKTGWASESNIGWFVGYVIHDYEEEIPKTDAQDTTTVVQTRHIRKGYYFATNIDIKDPKDATAREGITIDILKSLNLI